jgi:hypothetical protein
VATRQQPVDGAEIEDSQALRLLDCADQLGKGQHGRQVEEGPRHAGDGDPVASGHILGVEAPDPVNLDPTWIRSSRRRDVQQWIRAAT